MTSDIAVAESRQGMMTEDFFYFFLRLRKERIRKTVKACRARYPDETPEGLARHLIASSSALSFMGGTLMHVPMLIPGIGQALKLLGLVGGASALTRMHLYLILEIALVYGKDIDAQERVPEMAAVVAATGLAASAPLLIHVSGTEPSVRAPYGGLGRHRGNSAHWRECDPALQWGPNSTRSYGTSDTGANRLNAFG